MRTFPRTAVLSLLVLAAFLLAPASGWADDKSARAPKKRAKTEVIFLVDHSGSMHDHLDAISKALETIAEKKPGMNRRYSYSVVDFTDDGAPVNRTSVALAKSDLRRAAAVVRLLSTKYSSGQEPSYDAAYMTAAGYLDTLLGLRPGAKRIIIVLTDEAGQSYLVAPLDSKKVYEAVAKSATRLVVITDPHHYDDWKRGDGTYELTSDTATAAKTLEKILFPQP